LVDRQRVIMQITSLTKFYGEQPEVQSVFGEAERSRPGVQAPAPFSSAD
jgi:hypothetical protein